MPSREQACPKRLLEKIVSPNPKHNKAKLKLHLMKLYIVILLLCLCAFLRGVELHAGFGYENQGTLKIYDYVGFNPDKELSNGYSSHLHIMFPFYNAKVGLGVESLMSREIKLDQPAYFKSARINPAVSFIPIYLVVKAPVHDKSIPIEFIGELGYCIHKGNADYLEFLSYTDNTSAVILKDGYYAAGGLGAYKGPILLSLMLKSEQVDVDFNRGRVTRVDVYHISLGIEYRYKIKPLF